MRDQQQRADDLAKREGRGVIELAALPDPESGTITIYNPDPEAKSTAWITSDTVYSAGDVE